MEMQVNPSPEQTKAILWIAGIIITIMLGIVGYFIGAQFQASKALTGAVITLDKSVTSLETQLKFQMPVTEKRLNSHADEIKIIEKRLTIIETDHQNFHKTKIIRHEKI